ncbi:MAG: hypothetical protein AMXMBFR82_15040 [Candidatus Hydrogenedentota bacterium]
MKLIPHSRLLRLTTLVLFLATIASAQDASVDYSIDVQTVVTHDDHDWLWFHPRAAAISGLGKDGNPAVIMTIQKHLGKSDHYSGLSVLRTDDLGNTWTGPTAIPELDAWEEGDGIVCAVADVTPAWHAHTEKIIAIGIKVRYDDGDQVYDKPRSHDAAYAVYDPASNAWSKWRMIDTPEAEGKFYLVSPGCGQYVIEGDGSILLPFYYRGPEGEVYSTTVMRCSFDGETMRYIEHGDELELAVERGLVEPSLITYRGKYYLTIRNDVKGYVTTSEDGLHFAPIQPWTFDDGEELGSYNTQQHWLTLGDRLFLVYTRRGANNDHIMRHRAPLFIAQVDPERLCILRNTERVLIPERGATLGNFGASPITPTESWVTVSEGIWSDDARARGAEGATFVTRVRLID